MTSYAAQHPRAADLGAPNLVRLRAAITEVLSAVRSSGEPGSTAPPVAAVSANGRAAEVAPPPVAPGLPEPSGPSEPSGPAGQPEAPGLGPAEDAWTLVAAAQRGDPEAFGRLYDRYVTLVFRYAYHRLGDRALAEDLTSETFLRALRRIGSVSDRGRDVGAWFITITRNLVIDHLKSSRHRLELVTGDMPEADRTAEGPEPAVLREISNAELLRCVRRLPAEQQECIVLRFLQDMSVAETARIMGKTEGAIKALQHRAVRRLAALLPEGLR